jgi:hypothetical protein
VCASLYEGNGKAKIALLCKLDYELKLYRRALESYIETEMREHKADLPAGYFSGAAEESKAPNPYLAMIVDLGQADNPIQQFFARNAGSKKIIGLYEIVLLFQGCLYDKGKNATQRLGMFKKTFIDQHKKLTAIGSESVDHTTTIFLGNIVTILNSNRALFTPPAVSSQWRIGMFAQSMAYYIPRRRSAPAVASTAVPSPQVTAKL